MIQITKEVLRDGLIRTIREQSRAGAFEVLMLLYAHSRDDSVVQIRRQDLVRSSGYSEYKIAQILRELQSAGWIERMNPRVRRNPSIFVLRKDL